MHDALKMLWLALGFNVLVALMNLGFAVARWFDGNLMSTIVSLMFTVINSVVAGFMWSKIKEQRQKDKQRVVDILSGKYDPLESFLH